MSEEKTVAVPPSGDELEKQMKALPQEQQTMIRAMMTSVQLTNQSNPESNLAKQWRPEHIQTYLDGARESMQNEYKDKQHKRWFSLAFVLIAAAVVAFVILVLKDQPDVMEKILYAAGGVIAGALGGYGYGKSKQE